MGLRVYQAERGAAAPARRLRHHGVTTGSTQKGAAWIVTTDAEHTWARYVRPLHIGPAALARR